MKYALSLLLAATLSCVKPVINSQVSEPASKSYEQLMGHFTVEIANIIKARGECQEIVQTVVCSTRYGIEREFGLPQARGVLTYTRAVFEGSTVTIEGRAEYERDRPDGLGELVKGKVITAATIDPPRHLYGIDKLQILVFKKHDHESLDIVGEYSEIYCLNSEGKRIEPVNNECVFK